MKASLFLVESQMTQFQHGAGKYIPDTITRGQAVLEVVDGVSGTLANGALSSCQNLNNI